MTAFIDLFVAGGETKEEQEDMDDIANKIGSYNWSVDQPTLSIYNFDLIFGFTLDHEPTDDEVAIFVQETQALGYSVREITVEIEENTDSPQ